MVKWRCSLFWDVTWCRFIDILVQPISSIFRDQTVHSLWAARNLQDKGITFLGNVRNQLTSDAASHILQDLNPRYVKC